MFEYDKDQNSGRVSVVASNEFSKNGASKSMHDFLFMVVAFCLVFFSVSLLSSSDLDNSFFVFNSQRNVYSNLCGAVGSYCASLLFFLFGYLAYVWVFVLSAAWGFRFYTKQGGSGLRQFAAGSAAFTFFLSLLSYVFGTLVETVTGKSFASLAGLVRLIGPVGVVMLSVIGFVYSLALLFNLPVRFVVAVKVKGLQVAARFFLAGASFCAQVLASWWQFVFSYVKAAFLKAFTPVFPQEVIAEQVGLSEKVIDISFSPQVESELEQELPVEDEQLAGEVVAPRLHREWYFGKTKLRLLPLSPFEKSLRNNQRFVALLKEALVYNFPLPDDALLIEEHQKSFDKTLFEQECKERGVNLEERLKNFGINGRVVAIRPGPVVTLYEYEPDMDVKISSIIAREDDLAMALKALSIRIVAPIPGTSVVGFEIANVQREDVFMSDLIVSDEWKKSSAHLGLLLGVDTAGKPMVQDLTTMPHLLVAGSTGSGKSVCMHSLLFSLLSKHTPETLRLVLIDPKRLEFSAYADIPHLLFPIVVEAQRTIKILKWVVAEMEYRYKNLAQATVRNIAEYNKKAVEKGLEKLPYLVVMIDELADLMIVAGKEIELQLIRIAQMARAAGIHMVLATQRPSVDVVTGLIKVNFPSRLGCRVSSKIDSRTILDTNGAEKLLGRGDMLFLHGSAASLRRIHGAYVSESQVQRLTDYLRSLGTPSYVDLDERISDHAGAMSDDQDDELYQQALEAIKMLDEVSISLLQRKFRIGFNRSARLIEQLEADGLLAPAQGSKPRKVLKL
ncbi:DNA translocase FtsK [Candidatus Dependentiae bacterium]|nr:DNA translocase FtsK [Candidatus Dependentiae bacterium]